MECLEDFSLFDVVRVAPASAAGQRRASAAGRRHASAAGQRQDVEEDAVQGPRLLHDGHVQVVQALRDLRKGLRDDEGVEDAGDGEVGGGAIVLEDLDLLRAVVEEFLQEHRRRQEQHHGPHDGGEPDVHRMHALGEEVPPELKVAVGRVCRAVDQEALAQDERRDDGEHAEHNYLKPIGLFRRRRRRGARLLRADGTGHARQAVPCHDAAQRTPPGERLCLERRRDSDADVAAEAIWGERRLRGKVIAARVVVKVARAQIHAVAHQ
mmetsp:Transcript_22363/g.79809  ORF Transcript_22363/g.79809 Transcript_22363/m.79809 type:complete len:267 (-) Transcript_22363:668-1468(-)